MIMLREERVMGFVVSFICTLLLSSCALNVKNPKIVGGNGEWIYLGWTIYGSLAMYKAKEIGVGGHSRFTLSGLPAGVYSAGLIAGSDCSFDGLIFKISIYDDGNSVYEGYGRPLAGAVSYYGVDVNQIKWKKGSGFFDISLAGEFDVDFSLSGEGSDACLVNPILSTASYDFIPSVKE